MTFRTLRALVLLVPVGLLVQGCCILGVGDCDDPVTPDGNGGEELALRNGQQAALDRIAAFRSRLAEEAGADAVALGSLQAFRPGDITILDCRGRLDDTSETVGARLGLAELPLREDPVRSVVQEFDWSRNWSEELGASVDVKLLDVLFEAAFARTSVQALRLRLGLADPVRRQLENPVILLDDWLGALDAQGTRSAGNVMVAAVILGRVSVEYAALSSSGDTLSLSVAAEINDRLGVDYARGGATSTRTRVLEESPDAPTAFATTFIRIPEEVQDAAYIQRQSDEVCTTGSDAPFREIVGIDQETGREVARFRVEESFQGTDPDTGVPRARWFLTVRNTSTETVTFQYQIRARSAFGPVNVATGLILSLPPGSVSDEGELLAFRNRIRLRDARLGVTIPSVSGS